jgi:hypothetical protein
MRYGYRRINVKVPVARAKPRRWMTRMSAMPAISNDRLRPRMVGSLSMSDLAIGCAARYRLAVLQGGDMSDRVDRANKIVFPNVQGWVGGRIFQVINFIDDLHTIRDIRGDIAEIGVHHGKLFFLMASILRSDERCIGVDLFDEQDKNIDGSGGGCSSIAMFNQNLVSYFPDLAEQVFMLSRDSMSITPHSARSILRTDGVRLFSVDGGHTPAHVINDMAIAQEVIVPFGVVMLDDFLGPAWPSVTEGLFAYMARSNVRLAPFLIFQNKLFLTTFSEHKLMLLALRQNVEKTVGVEIHHKWRYTQMCGHEVLAYYGS